jgi:hypothetical protein
MPLPKSLSVHIKSFEVCSRLQQAGFTIPVSQRIFSEAFSQLSKEFVLEEGPAAVGAPKSLLGRLFENQSHVLPGLSLGLAVLDDGGRLAARVWLEGAASSAEVTEFSGESHLSLLRRLAQVALDLGLASQLSYFFAKGRDEEAGLLAHRLVERGLVRALEAALAGKLVPDLDARDENGLSALHLAVAKEELACVKVLLSAGADPAAFTGTEVR